MALLENPMAVAVLVVAVIVAVMALNTATQRRPQPPPTRTGPAQPQDSLLARFAIHQGSVVGEVVAEDGERLILKQAGLFKAVPRAGAQSKEGEVHLAGDIDWAAAESEGKAWHERNRRRDDGVAGELTTSADVKHPALQATRQDDEPRPSGADAPKE